MLRYLKKEENPQEEADTNTGNILIFILTIFQGGDKMCSGIVLWKELKLWQD